MSRSLACGLAILVNVLCDGCLPERVDKAATLQGRPLMALMGQIGQPLEDFTPPEGDEGRIINEGQKLWHYLRVSSTTSLVIIRSRYSSLFTVQETVHASFENPAFGTLDINAFDDDTADGDDIHAGYIKFTTPVESPSPGIAKAEIYPFPRAYGGETFPPSMQMVLPPNFVVPSNSHIDPRKKFMRDTRTMQLLQKLVREVFSAGIREVPMPAKG